MEDRLYLAWNVISIDNTSAIIIIGLTFAVGYIWGELDKIYGSNDYGKT